jgi:hypothetical protein
MPAIHASPWGANALFGVQAGQVRAIVNTVGSPGDTQRILVSIEGIFGSLSEILCVRHNMSPRSMYAKQDTKEETGSGAAQYSERTD